MTGFALDPRLAANTRQLADWPLSRVLVMNEARYRWLLLVPRRPGVTEIIDLDDTDSQQLLCEIRAASKVLQSFPETHKINVAALGNMVPQLHVHVIARRLGDPAWPGVVWDKGPAEAMDGAKLAERMGELRARIAADPAPR